jgi:hypothetical protein
MIRFGQVLFGVGGFALKNNNDLAKLIQENLALLNLIRASGL